ncbi:MAG: helix-hairpin-helix domain-containing protein [Pseudomonadota bacterium]
MLKKILAVLALTWAASCFAAVDVNKATVAELDSVKGIGPATSRAIVAERKKGNFANWKDFIERVKGVREATAIKYSKAGLTINGALFTGFNPPAAKADPQAEARAAAETAEGDKVLQQTLKVMATPTPDSKPAARK